MKFFLASLTVCLFLSACSSEVDKCVDSQVKGWEAEQNRLKADVESGRKKIAKPNIFGFYDFADESSVKLDERTKTEVEAEYRGWCLRISKK